MKEGVLPPHFHTCWRKYCLVLDDSKNIAFGGHEKFNEFRVSIVLLDKLQELNIEKL